MAADTTPLADAAVQMHEAVTAFEAAGFSRAEAIQIVIGMARNGS